MQEMHGGIMAKNSTVTRNDNLYSRDFIIIIYCICTTKVDNAICSHTQIQACR